MLGYLPRLLLILIFLSVILPFSTIFLGLTYWALAFFWLFFGGLIVYLIYRQRDKEREKMNYNEVLSQQRREQALKEWIEIHKKDNE